MIKVIVGNSYSKIEGLAPVQEREVRNLLSYNISAQASYFSGSFKSPKRYLIDKKGHFPTGLLADLTKYLKKYKHKIVDTRKRPEGSINLFRLSPGVTPYEDQTNAVAASVLHFRGIISATTGSGKSILMALLVYKLQLKTLIIVPNLELKNQLKTTFTKLFGSLNNITIENIDSPVLETASDYDVLMIDEAHHVAAKTYRKLNKTVWNNIYYRFFLTATPYRSKDEEQMLFQSIAGELIYEITYNTAVSKGYIVPIEAYFLEVPKKKVKGYNWATVYSEIVVNNKERNELIAKLLISLSKSEASTLCLVKEIKHGENIQALTGAGFANGQSEDCRMLIDGFNAKKLTGLIGTVGVLGEGTDTKPCEYVIITGLGKAKGQFLQMCGRGVRTYPGKESCKIFIFKDMSHKWSIAHFKAQVKYLREEYGVEPIKLDI